MDRDQVRTVVQVTLAVLTRIASKTRTQADDLMATVLQANEERIVDAVLQLLADPGSSPTEPQIVEALANVGIRR